MKVKPWYRPWGSWMYVKVLDGSDGALYGLTLDKNEASILSVEGLYRAQDYYLLHRQKLEKYYRGKQKCGNNVMF